jgi:hypothetical protein
MIVLFPLTMEHARSGVSHSPDVKHIHIGEEEVPVLQGPIIVISQEEEEAMHASGPIVIVDDEGPDDEGPVRPLPFLSLSLSIDL